MKKKAPYDAHIGARVRTITREVIARNTREMAALRAKITDTQKRLDAEILRNATPIMTMKASPGYFLIVECENFAMQIRTPGVTVKASKRV